MGIELWNLFLIAITYLGTRHPGHFTVASVSPNAAALRF